MFHGDFMQPMAAEQTVGVRSLIRSWQRQLRRQPTIRERTAMKRVSELEAIAAETRRRVLAGTASLADLRIADAMARRAQHDMERLLERYRVPSSIPSLSELMARARP
jgi:hypothetical protein